MDGVERITARSKVLLSCLIIVFCLPWGSLNAYGQQEWESSYMQHLGGTGYAFISVNNLSTNANTVKVDFVDQDNKMVASESVDIAPGEVWALNPADFASKAPASFNGYVGVSASEGAASIMPWGAVVFPVADGLSGFPLSWKSSSGVPYQPEKASPVSLYKLLSVSFKEKYPKALRVACPACKAIVNRANEARADYIDLRKKRNVDAVKHAIKTLQALEEMNRDQWDKVYMDDQVISAGVDVEINEWETRINLECAQDDRKKGDSSMAASFMKDANELINKNIKLRQKKRRLEKQQRERLNALDKKMERLEAELGKHEAVLRKMWKAKKKMEATMASAEKCLEQFCTSSQANHDTAQTSMPLAGKDGELSTGYIASDTSPSERTPIQHDIIQDNSHVSVNFVDVPGADTITEPIIRPMPKNESAASKASSAVGGLLGGMAGMGAVNPFGGGGGNGARLASTPKGPWDEVSRGKTALQLGGWMYRPRSKKVRPQIRIAQKIADSPDDGAPDSMWLQDANGNLLQPVGFMVFELWRHWKLTITITRETYVDGVLVDRKVTRESTEWKELVGRYKALLSAPAIWQRLGGHAFDKLRGVIVEFALPANFDPSKWSLISHITSKARVNGKEVIQTVPFVMEMKWGDNHRLRFTPPPDGLTRYQRAHVPLGGHGP